MKFDATTDYHDKQNKQYNTRRKANQCDKQSKISKQHNPTTKIKRLLAGCPSGSSTETVMGEVEVLCCGDTDESEGEHGPPDGVSLIPLDVFGLA